MKAKNEDRIANYVTRREWMSRITSYLILILIGLIYIVVNFSDSLDRIGHVFGLLASATTLFMMVYLMPEPYKAPLSVDNYPYFLLTGSVNTVVVSALVQVGLLRLVG